MLVHSKSLPSVRTMLQDKLLRRSLGRNYRATTNSLVF